MPVQRVLRKINKVFYPQRLFFHPEFIILGVNNICNLHCKMCDVGADFRESNFYDHMMGAQPMNMPLDLLKRVVDDMARSFPSAKLGFAFTEPIIYPHLIEGIQYAAEKQIYTSMTTNASKLPKLAEQICNAGLKELCISLDGPEEVHNAIRGNKHSFEWAINGIEAVLRQKKRPTIKIFCSINEWNIGVLESFANYFSSLKIEEIGFMHYTFVTDKMAVEHNKLFHSTYPTTASNMSEADFGKLNIELLYQEISNLRNKNYPYKISFSPELHTKEQLTEFYFTPEKKIGRTCNNIFTSVMIKSNGDVIPAHSRCYNVNAGNMYNNSLTEIWNSAIISEFRKTIVKHGGMLPACTRCCSAY